MWQKQKVSVIFPTYNEKDSIYSSIQDFFASKYVDEIIVVNNNAASGTKEEVDKTKAIQVFETKQGYGHAIRRGFKEVKGDIIIISEPDGTFSGKDILKLLSYSDNFDVVFGSRTWSIMIQQGANMGFFLKWGNWFLAKLMQFSFNTTRLTDIGCTMRLIKKDALNKIEKDFTVGSSHFGVEMMLLIMSNKIRFIEVPVSYHPRVGQSSVTGSKIKAFFLGLDMLSLVIKHRIKSLF
ncbi:MAG TPA: glycosyltransferase family 2 protein [Candidatus Nanoarchaeia archaeon]|nr:glycosyltransferase family 2 protein [Candidatus Nanoarchaeia archaeon]